MHFLVVVTVCHDGRRNVAWHLVTTAFYVTFANVQYYRCLAGNKVSEVFLGGVIGDGVSGYKSLTEVGHGVGLSGDNMHSVGVLFENLFATSIGGPSRVAQYQVTQAAQASSAVTSRRPHHP